MEDLSLARRNGRGILGWFGRNQDSDSEGEQPPARPASGAEDPLRMVRRQLLGDITEFLLAHDLEVNGFTLAIVHDYLTGTDGNMVRAIDRRIQSAQPVTLEWLEQTSREATIDQREVLTQLMTKLETNIEELGQTASAAKSVASDYNSALAAHVDELDVASKAPAAGPEVLEQFVSIARTMLARTRDLEQEMGRNALQTKALRRSLEQARRAAEKDHLTGLPNRRAFENRFSTEFASAREAGEQLCVAFCDIDNFKHINDEHGHEAGDRVLKTVAANLARISDDRCHVARHGGEEFVVLLRGRSLNEAWEMLDESRQQMAERRLINRSTDKPFGKVTFSGGVADVMAFSDPRAALRAADKALYRAKAEGRNRILVADEGSPVALKRSA